MAVKLSSLRIDKKRENDGEWCDFPEHMDTETGEVPGLKVRGSGYAPFQAAKSIVEGRWVREYGTSAVPVEIMHKANGRLYADHILLDWRGFAEPYEAEYARNWLADLESRPTHELIRLAMTRVGRVEAEFVRDVAGNS